MHRKHGSAILTGIALHLGANTAMKALKSSSTGHKLEAAMIAKGIQNGIKGRNISHTARQVATFGIGPEALVPHDLGRMVGEKMQGMSPSRRRRVMKVLRRRLASEPEILKAPNGMASLSALNQVLGDSARPVTWHQRLVNKLPTAASNAKLTLRQKALGPALGAAAFAASPGHAGVHMGINAAREGLGNSSLGKSFLQKQLNAGLSGKKIHPFAGAATDLLVSPSALDTRRMGLAIRSAAAGHGISLPKNVNLQRLLTRF